MYVDRKNKLKTQEKTQNSRKKLKIQAQNSRIWRFLPPTCRKNGHKTSMYYRPLLVRYSAGGPSCCYFLGWEDFVPELRETGLDPAVQRVPVKKKRSVLPGIVGFPFTNGDTIGEDHHQSNLGTVGGVTVFAQSILTNGLFIDPSSDTGPLSSFGAFCLTMQIDRRYQSCHGAFILIYTKPFPLPIVDFLSLVKSLDPIHTMDRSFL